MNKNMLFLNDNARSLKRCLLLLSYCRYFLERSHSARLTLAKACELCPEEVKSSSSSSSSSSFVSSFSFLLHLLSSSYFSSPLPLLLLLPLLSSLFHMPRVLGHYTLPFFSGSGRARGRCRSGKWKLWRR